MARRCTFSSVSISFLRYGFQADTANSSCGLTYVVYNFFQICVSLVTNVLFSIPKTLQLLQLLCRLQIISDVDEVDIIINVVVLK